jgi:hypothetical protein
MRRLSGQLKLIGDERGIEDPYTRAFMKRLYDSRKTEVNGLLFRPFFERMANDGAGIL